MYRKDHDVNLMLLSYSITGTLFTSHEADQIDAYRYNAFHLASLPTRSRVARVHTGWSI